MKRILSLILICLIPFVSQAAEVAVPVMLNSPTDGSSYGGFISAAPTPQRPDALSILRAQLQREEHLAQQKASRDGVFWSTTKRFTPESLTFFVAIGAVTFNSMWIKSQGDPLAMDRHLKSIKDPIAHLSFYAFMQTQGFYMNFHTTKKGFQTLDPTTRAQMMRRLSYQGMMWGSLASSIVADLGQSVTMCVDKWFKGKKDSASLAVCDQAWKGWTLRSKFTQYFPQIISMWASQAATEFIEGAASRGFAKVSASAWARKILTREFLVKAAYRLTGADVVTVFVGGGWVTKSIKIVGKVTRFAGFVAVDHILSNYTYPIVNSIIQPALFEADAINIDRLWAEADKGKWNLQGTKRAPYMYCDKVGCRTIDQGVNVVDFENAIEKYGERMQQWRDNLNMDADQDMNGWMEMTKKILSQVEYSYNYYKNFVGELNNFLYQNEKTRTGQMHFEANVLKRFPVRPLPFYGVTTRGCQFAGSDSQADQYLLSPNEIEACQMRNVQAAAQRFKNAPAELQSHPRDLQKYNALIAQLASNNPQAMGSALYEIVTTIGLYQQQISMSEAGSIYNPSYIDALEAIQKFLGNPEPQLYPLQAFARLADDISETQELKKAASFGKFSITQGFIFNTETDQLNYKMICGSQVSQVRKIKFLGVSMVQPQFQPPAILKSDAARAEFCARAKSPKGLYDSPVAGMNLGQYFLKNLNFNALGDYRGEKPADAKYFERWWQLTAKRPINSQFREYDQKFRKIYQTSRNNFYGNTGWFKKSVANLNQSMYLPRNIENSLRAEANLYFQILTRVGLRDSVAQTPTRSTVAMPNAPTGWWDKTKSFFGRYVFGGFNNFSNIYKDLTLRFDYLEFTTESAMKSRNFNPIYRRNVREVLGIYNAFNGYYSFIADQYPRNSASYKTCLQQKMRERNELINRREIISGEMTNQDIMAKCDFEQYVAGSKNVDTQINDLLVILGLKRVVQGGAAAVSDDMLDFSAAPAATGHENSPKSYEDVQVQNPTYKQRMAIAAVRGLRRVESELRKYIRMKYSLRTTLELDDQEFLKDWSQLNIVSGPRNNRSVAPFGR